MTIDEIVQRIYEERYVEPKQPEIAKLLRDGMVREIVQRTLELALPNTTPVTGTRTIEQAITDAEATIRAHDRSGRKLTAITADAWDMLGDRCIADAVRPDTDAHAERYQESITLAGLCYANAREARAR